MIAWDTYKDHYQALLIGLMDSPDEGWAIMQFTGLHDKNGKEIYEGDMLNSLYRNDGCKGTYEVIWAEAGFHARKHGEHQQRGVSIYPNDLTRCEVIGNIWENPELLS